MIEVRIPAEPNYPDRRTFLDALTKRIGNRTPYLQPILTICAEEAERVIMNHWFSKEKGEPVVEIQYRSRAQYGRHYCPNCGNMMVYPSHKYCPICGIKIVWK